VSDFCPKNLSILAVLHYSVPCAYVYNCRFTFKAPCPAPSPGTQSSVLAVLILSYCKTYVSLAPIPLF